MHKPLGSTVLQGVREKGSRSRSASEGGWKAVQPFVDPERLVFIDETGVNTKMARL
jgi:hypothetical protein